MIIFSGIVITSDHFLVFLYEFRDVFAAAVITFRGTGTRMITLLIFRDVYAAIRLAGVIIFQ